MKLKWWHVALLISIAVALLSPLASDSPDGLERAAEDKGFLKEGSEAPYQIIADYVFPGIENEALATMLAGIIGTLLIFGVVYGLALLVRRRRKAAPE